MVFRIVMNKQNQQQFFEDVIEQHKGILFKVAKTYCRNDDDRQDLVQEMMIQIWRSLHRYNNQFAITTWLYRVSLNVAISFYRKNSTKQNLRVPLIDEVLLIQDPKPFEREEQLELLDQFISELNDLDRALMLLYLEDKSHAEISEIIGISVTNVGTKLGRIKEKLKKKFSLINK
jgi:RNA polymerase sigma-70 factor (ECF subfamily)